MNDDPEMAVLHLGFELTLDIEGQREAFTHVRQRHVIA